MRAFLILLFMSVATNVMAVEPVDEQQIMFYYHIPLGADKQHSKHEFGLRLDQTSHDPRDVVQLNALEIKPAAMDFRMGYDGVQSFEVRGVDYAKYLIARAAEGEEAPVEPATETPAETAPVEAAPAEAATPPAEGEATTEPAAAETAATAEVPKEEQGPIAKTISELPVGFFLGAAVGLLILVGAGG